MSRAGRSVNVPPPDRSAPRTWNVRLQPPAAPDRSKSGPTTTRTASSAPESAPASLPPTVLLADDNDDDVLTICKALAKAKVPYALKVVRDGEEAMNYLKGAGEFSDRHEHPFPVLLLLDLKMPRATGFDVLEWLSRSSNLSRLIVVVLTGSDLNTDMERAFHLGANSYLVKTPSYDDLVNFLKSFDLSR